MRALVPFFFCVLFLSAAHAKESRDPKYLFMMECQGCHLSDGSGGVNEIPPLTNHVAKFLSVEGGRAYLAQVPGVARSSLTDNEMASVLNWLVHAFGPPDIADQYPAYTVEEVTVLRSTPLTEVLVKRAHLIDLIDRHEKTLRSN